MLKTSVYTHPKMYNLTIWPHCGEKVKDVLSGRIGKPMRFNESRHQGDYREKRSAPSLHFWHYGTSVKEQKTQRSHQFYSQMTSLLTHYLAPLTTQKNKHSAEFRMWGNKQMILYCTWVNAGLSTCSTFLNAKFRNSLYHSSGHAAHLFDLLNELYRGKHGLLKNTNVIQGMTCYTFPIFPILSNFSSAAIMEDNVCWLNGKLLLDMPNL